SRRLCAASLRTACLGGRNRPGRDGAGNETRTRAPALAAPPPPTSNSPGSSCAQEVDTPRDLEHHVVRAGEVRGSVAPRYLSLRPTTSALMRGKPESTDLLVGYRGPCRRTSEGPRRTSHRLATLSHR